MSISDFKDSIILDRQRGATYQAIADRFNCSRQCIERLLHRWNAKDVLAPTKHDRARQALQLIIDGEEASLSKAARFHRVTEDMIRKIAKKEDVDLRGFLKRNQAKIKAHSLDGQQFTALKLLTVHATKTTLVRIKLRPLAWCAELVKVFALPTSKLVIQRLAASHVAGVFVKLIALRPKNVMQSLKLMNWRCSKNADLNVATQCVDDLSLHVIHIGFISNLLNSKRLVI